MPGKFFWCAFNCIKPLPSWRQVFQPNAKESSKHARNTYRKPPFSCPSVHSLSYVPKVSLSSVWYGGHVGWLLLSFLALSDFVLSPWPWRSMQMRKVRRSYLNTCFKHLTQGIEDKRVTMTGRQLKFSDVFTLEQLSCDCHTMFVGFFLGNF